MTARLCGAFAGIEFGDDRIPDETTILNFRHLLERKRNARKLVMPGGAAYHGGV